MLRSFWREEGEEELLLQEDNGGRVFGSLLGIGRDRGRL
jgi:hypothetical protein